MPTENQKPADERPEDVNDPSLDDGYEELEAAEEAAADKVAPEKDKEEDEKKPLEYEADPRDEIEESISAKKNDGEQQGEEEEEPIADEAEQDDEELEANIDGQKVKVKPSELEKRLAEYQKHETADKRLREASELLRQAKELSASTKPATVDNEGAESESQTPTSESDENIDDLLAKVGEKLQYGETKDVVEALKTVIEQAKAQVRPQEPQLDEAKLQAAMLEVQERQRSDEALRAFSSENEELGKNERLQGVFRDEIGRVLRSEVRDALSAQGASQDQLNQVDTLSEAQIVQAHRTMRVNGVVKSDTAHVLQTAKDNLVKATLWPGASAVNPDRQARKQSAQQQPAARSRPNPPNAQQQRRTAAQTVADIVAEEQEARGNPVI